MKSSTNLQRKLPLIIGGVISVSIVAAVVFFIINMLDAPPAKPKKMVQNITFVTPPPPPPPPDEPPPEPEVQEEVEVPEPEAEPEEIPDAPAEDMPPVGDLGLDAEGVAGGDAFGLLARKGGRDLLLGGGGQAAKRQYGLAVKSDIQDFLSDIEEIRKSEYDIKIKFWYDEKGNITKFEMLESTGNKKLDKTMKTTLSRYEKLPYEPPGGNANTITLQIVSRT